MDRSDEMSPMSPSTKAAPGGGVSTTPTALTVPQQNGDYSHLNQVRYVPWFRNNPGKNIGIYTSELDVPWLKLVAVLLTNAGREEETTRR